MMTYPNPDSVFPFAQSIVADYLAEREQLMHDIECIVESHIFSQWGSEYGDVSDELIRSLCDAVCKNFPTTN